MDCKFTKNYFKERKRMCNFYCRCDIDENTGLSSGGCANCPLHNEADCYKEEYLEVVQKWSNEHPLPTRRTEFQKLVPEVKLKNGYPEICIKDITGKCCKSKNPNCAECIKNFWDLEMEIDEEWANAPKKERRY